MNIVSHPVGSVVSGKVRNLTEFGAFVQITEEIDGLVHVSDMSWTKRIKHPSEVLNRGEELKARITNIDVENQRVSLSIKEFLPNEWSTFAEKHKVGDVVTGPVVNVTDFGIFVDIFDGLEGLAHVSEIDVEGSLEDAFPIGTFVNARVLRIEEEEKKVGLTMRGVDQPSIEEIAELQQQREAATGDSDEEPEAASAESDEEPEAASAASDEESEAVGAASDEEPQAEDDADEADDAGEEE
jgi:small subunit ribosomal protein S1